MASDTHAHPDDLFRRFPGAEEERRRLGIACAASSWHGEEYARNKALAAAAERDGAPPLVLCFAVHPQLPAEKNRAANASGGINTFREELDLLEALARAGELAAVGETGFDLYNDAFKETEAVQDALFAAHLDIAGRYGLPVVLHVRRGMHNIFRYAKELKRLPAAVFHSWPGVPDEGFSLLRRGVNAFFSFGTTLLLNHKNAIRSCAAFPASRLLVETDAPWQPLRGRDFSRWGDLFAILQAAADIQQSAAGLTVGLSAEGEGGQTVIAGTDTVQLSAAAQELEKTVDNNFFSIFGR